VNHLLARSDYRVVPWLVGLAFVYVAGLLVFHASPVQILHVLGVSCTLMFAICWWFVRRPAPVMGRVPSAQAMDERAWSEPGGGAS